MKTVHIVIATIFQNGGDATRALEIAKIIKASQPEGYKARITFISRGSKFEKDAKRLGFDIYQATPKLGGIRFQDDFQTKFGDLIGSESLATDILAGEIAAYQTLKPDLLLYGFWPIGSIAQRMAIPDTKTIAFLPLPLKEPFLNMVTSFPNELLLARLPQKIQRFIMTMMPFPLKLQNPALKHRSIRKAAENLGWHGKPLAHIFEMLRPDLYLVNDFPNFYDSNQFDNKIIFTGPLYAQSEEQTEIPTNLKNILDPTNTRTKIFCTLGSSGDKKHLLEIIDVFNHDEGQEWSGIILSPKAICPLAEAKAALKNHHVVITDQFVPAKAINKQVDLVICHGGQGTLQTAITSGTPLVGIATQPEQKINLDHLAAFGMAITVRPWQWRAATIRQSVSKILASPSYQEKARTLKDISSQIKTHKIIADTLWKEILTLPKAKA